MKTGDNLAALANRGEPRQCADQFLDPSVDMFVPNITVDQIPRWMADNDHRGRIVELRSAGPRQLQQSDTNPGPRSPLHACPAAAANSRTAHNACECRSRY